MEELLASCKEGIGPDGRVFFGSFPSEIRPEHMTVEALRLVKRYCANDNLIVGAQSGSERVLEAAKRGHGVEEVRRAVRIGIAEGFRINVDMIFGMPGEEPADADASLRWRRSSPTSVPASTRTCSCRCRARRGGTRRPATSTRRRSAPCRPSRSAGRAVRALADASASTPPASPPPRSSIRAPAAAAPCCRSPKADRPKRTVDPYARRVITARVRAAAWIGLAAVLCLEYGGYAFTVAGFLTAAVWPSRAGPAG